jgi:hypothetical protein
MLHSDSTDSKSDSDSDSDVEILICVAITASGGTRCSRPSTKVRNTHVLCTQHYKSFGRNNKKHAHVVVTSVDPWINLRIKAPSDQNSLQARHKLRLALLAGPARRDCEGYLYIYYLERDRLRGCHDYWKVGMTTREDVADRIQYWRALHGPRAGFTHKRTYPTRYAAMAERLVHLYLDYCRMQRRAYTKTPTLTLTQTQTPITWLHSTWYATKEPVQDAQQEPHKEFLKGSHTEWFSVELDVLHAIVRDVVCMLRVWEKRSCMLL